MGGTATRPVNSAQPARDHRAEDLLHPHQPTKFAILDDGHLAQTARVQQTGQFVTGVAATTLISAVDITSHTFRSEGILSAISCTETASPPSVIAITGEGCSRRWR